MANQNAETVRVTYWPGWGRCEPLRCILAAAGVPFTNNFLTAESGRSELESLRTAGILQWDQVPLVEMDGRNLVQVNAVANYLGTRCGLLPSDAGDSYLVQGVWASCQDARAALLGFPFSAYPAPPSKAQFDSTRRGIMGEKGLVGRYTPKWENMLATSDGPFFLGDKPSIADIGVFEVIDLFRQVFGLDEFERAFEAFPRVRALVDAAKRLGNLAEHCDVTRKKYATWDEATGTHMNWIDYARAVRTTLD
eukprot:CAMPEP_0119312960 /NCGR_PEP_ID=MMETSP1333-20130426/27388_1 /TAXON_ID=418940 /ORGANISM="Scyphosphaera apsteinii, Strain RCC1455" /LENGTH=250 /DNA_ID=CAMNT_0007317669 /DNA_START=23 /DNA_END=775 /DNA_ORIENTATION=+